MAATCDCCGRRWDGCKAAEGACSHCGEATGRPRVGRPAPLCGECERMGACPACGAMPEYGYGPFWTGWEPALS